MVVAEHLPKALSDVFLRLMLNSECVQRSVYNSTLPRIEHMRAHSDASRSSNLINLPTSVHAGFFWKLKLRTARLRRSGNATQKKSTVLSKNPRIDARWLPCKNRCSPLLLVEFITLPWTKQRILPCPHICIFVNDLVGNVKRKKASVRLDIDLVAVIPLLLDSKEHADPCIEGYVDESGRSTVVLKDCELIKYRKPSTIRVRMKTPTMQVGKNLGFLC